MAIWICSESSPLRAAADAAAELVQLATEIGDLGELDVAPSLGNSDAANVLLELDANQAGWFAAGGQGQAVRSLSSVQLPTSHTASKVPDSGSSVSTASSVAYTPPLVSPVDVHGPSPSRRFSPPLRTANATAPPGATAI